MSTCLSDEQLNGYNAGELNHSAREQARKHLDDCPACSKRNAELCQKHDDLLDQVRQMDLASGLTMTKPDDPSKHNDAHKPPASIEGYDILRELSRGGQGVVYQAVQKSTKRKVAIKVLLAGEHASDWARRRFEREIELVAQLKHENIISILHAGKTPMGQQYYVMNYVRGKPLSRYIHNNRPSMDESLRLFIRICEAVQFAHQHGIIHRDLKPSNILVDVDGNPKLLDFGLARWTAHPVDTVVSMTQAMLGTLPYMSPEQTRGNPDEIDTRSDIYALGVVLYEMLTGHYPYPVAGQMMEVLKHIAETPPTPPSRAWTQDSGVVERSSRSGSRAQSRTRSGSSPVSTPKSGTRSSIRTRRCPIDDELQTVVLKTLAKERERRYQSAGELARDLEHYLNGEAIEAKRDSGWYVLKTQVRRHKYGVLTSAAAIALFTTIGVYANNVQHRKLLEVELTELIGLGRQRHAEGRLLDAYEAYNKALELDPYDYRALANKAIILKEQYFFTTSYAKPDPSLREEAIELCNRALDMVPPVSQQPPDRQPAQAGLWNLKAVLLHDRGDLEAAEEAARTALDYAEEFHNAWSVLGKILASQRRLDEAAEALERGSRLSLARRDSGKFDDNVVRYHGVLQLMLGDPRAETSFLDARDMQRKDERNWLMLARMHLTLPGNIDVEKAFDEATVAHAYNPHPDDPRYSRILAQACLAIGRHRDAVTHAEMAIERGDEPAYSHLIAAIAEGRQDDFASARDHLESAAAAWPEEFGEFDYLVQAKRGMLWFDTLEELESLRAQAEALVQ